jgi:CheY-like chemotaxis protein
VAKKVLVADDSNTIRKAFDLTFDGDSGVEVFGSGDAASALAAAREQSPDLIIADSNLGSASGYDLCKQLKSDAATAGIPVWIMTGPAERLDEDMYASCNADGHVRKPWDSQRLIDKVAVMSSTPDEERARPSYPPAPAGKFPVGKPQIPAPKPAAPPPAPPAAPQAIGVQARRGHKATLMGGPVAPPVQPAAAPKPAPLEAQQPPAPVAKLVADAPMAPLDDGIAASATASRALAGLSDEQRDAVMALVREVVEKTVWEVVPDMAEALITEELARLLKQ